MPVAEYWNLPAALADRIESVARQYPIDASGACNGCVTRTRLAVWLRRSAAMITDGLGARTAVWSGGHESRAGK